METTKTFQELGVSEEILRALEKKGVAMPTRVQEEAIPPLLAWRDVIAKRRRERARRLPLASR